MKMKYILFEARFVLWFNHSGFNLMISGYDIYRSFLSISSGHFLRRFDPLKSYTALIPKSTIRIRLLKLEICHALVFPLFQINCNKIIFLFQQDGSGLEQFQNLMCGPSLAAFVTCMSGNLLLTCRHLSQKSTKTNAALGLCSSSGKTVLRDITRPGGCNTAWTVIVLLHFTRSRETFCS